MNDLIRLAREKNITPDQFREAYADDERIARCETVIGDSMTWCDSPHHPGLIEISMTRNCDMVDLSPKSAIRWAEGLIEAARKLL